MLLLFPPERRPDREQVVAAVAAIEALTISAEGPDGDWVELLSSGLTFECSGFSPGPLQRAPSTQSWIRRAEADSSGDLDTIAIGLGPHIRAGQGMVPILRALLTIGHWLSERLEGCVGVHWLASGRSVNLGLFAEMVARFDGTGPVPMNLLAATRTTESGATETSGLGYFTGQEVRLEANAAADPMQAIVLVQRIAAQLIHRGMLETCEQTIGPDGATLTLTPSSDGTIVVVRRS